MQIKCKSRTFTSTYFHFLEFSVFQSIHPGSIIVGYVHIFPALEMMDWLLECWSKRGFFHQKEPLENMYASVFISYTSREKKYRPQSDNH